MRPPVCVALAALVPFAACDGGGAREPQRDHELVVFAAASLRDAFVELGRQFEREQPNVDIAFNFAGTQELRRQIEQGARVDVLAAADRRHVDALAAAGRVREPVTFAANRPVIVVANDATSIIRSLADLPNAERLVIGAPEVPIGAYTLELLARAEAQLGAGFAARVQERVVSRELNVRQVLAKVRLGEAQAGVVYRSDVHGVDDVVVLELPPGLDVLAEYPVAIATDASAAAPARAFVALLLSPAGQAALARAGFLPAATGG